MNQDFLTQSSEQINVTKFMDEEFEILDDFAMVNVTEHKSEASINKSKFNKPTPFRNLSKVKNVIKGYNSVKKKDKVYNKIELENVVQKTAILDMCRNERKLPQATKEFKKVMDKLESYAKSKSYDSEQETLSEAMKSIQSYIANNSVATNDNELELLERVKLYSYFFKTKSEGTLSGYEHKKENTVANPDAGSMNVWKDVSNHKLFLHEPSVMDVKQRRTEDCYMLSTLSGIAFTSPELIRQSMKDNGDGTVTVRFYDGLDKVVQYKDLTIEQIYQQQHQNEVEADVMALTKLFSDMMQNQRFIDEYIKDRAENGVEDNEEEPQVVEEVKQDIEFSKDLIDGFEEDDDFATPAQPVETQQRKQDEVNKRKLDFTRVAERVSGYMYSNNANWYTEVFNRCLTEEGKQKQVLTKILNKIKSNEFSEEAQKDALREFLDEMYKDSSLSSSFGEMKTESQRIENKEVFVTVTKEISTVAGLIEKNAADSLWVQMIEKAYAARYGKIDGADRGLTGYKGISLKNSFLFVNRFLNRNYENRQIIYNSKSDIVLSDEIKLEQKDIEKLIGLARDIHDEKSVTIENVMKTIMAQSEYAGLTPQQQQQIIKKLGEDWGIMHEEFTGKYTEKAEAEFEKISNMLQNKEFVTVGVNKEKQSKERIDALNSSGIRVGHAYAVIACSVQDNAKFVTLRDPYGIFRREYNKQEHADGTTSYKKVNASQIYLSGSDTMGIFNMELNDFLSTFDTYSGILKG